MLRFLAHLMRTRLPQLSRYLDMSLATSCDLPPSHDPSALTPAGYEHPRPPQARSCYQPPSHGPQDQGYRTVPRSPPPSLHLPALEETKLAMPPHLPSYMLELEKTKLTTPPHLSILFPQKPASSELFLGQAPLRLEKTKLVTPLHLPLYANVGYEQPQPPQATSCDQPPSHGQQDQGYRTCPRSPPPTCKQALSSLDPLRPSPRALTHRTRGTGCVHSLLLPALILPITSELRTAPAPSGCPHGPRPTGPGMQDVPTLSSSQLRASYEQP